MLDEKALRRETFEGGVPIVLGDGQSWQFPKPMLTFYPADDGESFGPAKYTLDEAFDGALEAFMRAEDDVLDLLLKLALNLFRRNYDVPKGGLATLFPYRPDDPANVEMWKEIRDVAWGRAPKPTAGGSATP